MIERHADRLRAITLGADKGYDSADFVKELRSMSVRPHVVRNTTRRFGRSAIDGAPRATRQRREPAHPRADRGGVRLDEDGQGMRRPMRRGTECVGWSITFAPAYNVVRLPKLLVMAA